MRNLNFSKPRLRQCYLAEVVQPRTLFLLSEHRHLVFEGEVYPALFPFLDGQHTFGEILGALAKKFSWGEVFGALGRLAGTNCLIEADGIPVPDNAPFWDHIVTAPEMAGLAGRLGSTTLSIQTVGNVDRTHVEEALRASGLNVQADGDYLVVLTDDYLRDELGVIDRERRASGRPWVLVKPIGIMAWIGPLFKPGQTACWFCLDQRLRANRQVDRYIRQRSGEITDLSKTRLDSISRSAASMAAIEIAKSIATTEQSALEGRIRTFDFLSLQIEEHTLVRRPQCPECGQTMPVGAPKPIVLETHLKHPGAIAGQRTAEPEDILRRYQHHVSPITGVVSSLVARDLQAYGVIHNYVAGHYFPVFSEDTGTLQTNLIARSGGKGSTESQAKASAIAESIERYSGIFWGDEYRIKASYSALAEEAVHPREILLFSEAQYAHHREWNSHAINQRHYVPDRLPDNVEISWTPAWSLTHSRTRYLPTAFSFYGHMDHGASFCRCDSNGCAAGNTREEAIVQGFMELAERDAVAIWWYNRIRRPAVDVSSFGISYWPRMREYYRVDLNRDFHVLDITNDLGVPTFAAVSRRLDSPQEDIIIGVGSHLDPTSAMTQALVEANQSVPILHYVGKNGGRLDRLHPKDVQAWLATATYANQQYLVPLETEKPRTFSDFRNLASNDVRDDVLACVTIAKERGLEMLVLDQTRPDIGLPVVRVVVPGLRHFWRRLAPGRLYDAPVALGWLREPIGENDLNPVSFFI